ncbi:Hsp20/alpha crystallin family protein [Pseudolysinimonas sp.]|jgi:HSP20 family protein
MTRYMPMDVARVGDRYVLDADLPGIDPATVDIDVSGRFLTIRAERPARSAEGATYLSRERAAGSFARRFTLGQGIDSTAISASYDNGVLSVVLPISEQAKPRKVAVQAAAPAETAEVAAA